MFSKAKLKRFNEEVGCAPPPTKYDARIEDKPVGVVMEKSERFKENKENTPAPNAYSTIDIPKKPLCPTPCSQTPRRPLSRLNASSASTSSVNSQKEFKSPANFTRTRSLKLVRSKEQKQLSSKIEELTKERDEFQEKFMELEAKIYSMELNASSHTEVASDMANQTPNENQILIEKEDYDLMRDEIEHLTKLRDNLEMSIRRRDDTVIDLQVQLDLIITQAQETDHSYESLKQEFSVISNQLEQSMMEKKEAESKVSDLVKKYESMISKQKEDNVKSKDLLAQKDIEIELLNDSIATLNTKVSEFEHTLSLHKSPQVSALDLTISSCSSKELKSEDLVDKIKQLSVEDSDQTTLLQQEKQKNADLAKSLEKTELKLKEKDVVQQFLEKEIKVRENEIAQNAWRIEELTSELTTTQMLVTGLQREAETQLNQLFCLKATLSAKEYDIEAKDDLISSLADKVLEKDQTKCATSEAGTSTLECEINHIKDILLSGRQNASQMEERVIELLAEVDERESQYKKQLQIKDSELEEISLKYSDALLQQEALKRLVNVTTEQLENTSLINQAMNLDHHKLKEELNEKKIQCHQLERNLTELTVKITHLEDALACEEEGSQNMQEDLEHKIDDLQAVCDHSKQELAKLQVTNQGYVSQINQLKIDMTKKCCAVEEMQKCIDALREEKAAQASVLSQAKEDYKEKDTLLNDLQEEFEDKMKTISDLKDDLQEKESTINTKSQELEKSTTQLRLVSAERDTLQQRLFDSQCEYQTIQAERNQIQQALWDHEGEFNFAVDNANREIEELKTELEITNQESGKEICDLEIKLKSIEDKFASSQSEAKELMVTLSEKSSLLDETCKQKNEIIMNMEIQQLALLNANTQLEKLTAEHAETKMHVLETDNRLSQLNHQMLQKNDEFHEILKQISHKDSEIETLRDTIAQLEAEVETSKEQRESYETSKTQLQEKEQQIESLKASCNELEHDLMNLKSSSKTREKELTMINMSLLEESESWKNKFTYLEEMIEPFREQLDRYDLEKAALISKNDEAKKEIDQLSKDYAKLIGHTNHKQKIQHMVKLKDQNNQLKEEVQKLRYEIEHIKHQKKTEKHTASSRSRAVEKTHPSERENKENEDYSVSPLRSSNRLHRI